MLAARDDLADKVSKVAESKGFTLFAMINSLLDMAIEVDKRGTSLEEAIDSYVTIKAVKEASFTLVLESLLYETAETAYSKAKEKTLSIWYDAGGWVARQYLSRGVRDPLGALGRDLKTLSWNIPEFTMERANDGVSVRVLSPRFSESFTNLYCRFLEGLLSTFKYSITHKDVGKGNIRLEAVKKEN
jgi:hypothetical protein